MGIKILVMEDDKPILDLFKIILEDFGEVIAVEDGAAGVEIIKKDENKSIGIIVSDVDMPKKDGFQAFSEIIEIRPDLKEKYIFTTGKPKHHADKIKSLGKNIKIIAKPFHIKELSKNIKALLSKKAET